MSFDSAGAAARWPGGGTRGKDLPEPDQTAACGRIEARRACATSPHRFRPLLANAPSDAHSRIRGYAAGRCERAAARRANPTQP
ncbi:hypothetical protein C7S16_1421 [Burkholderia thailandensis]|uniref:Uncharacterized protein n=1 Tax=Burkholderia thailandensis TaxID=57975 RepID=A0AAW9CX15_BURTH|nr:hypothetical protein [Burkholderia thailandensis]